MKIWLRWLIVLAVFGIPIEHKYDKPLRHFALSLIPQGLELPRWFDKKFHLYPSDAIFFFSLLIAATIFRVRLRRLFFENGAPLLFAMGLIAALSIYFSPLWNYPVAYSRLIQWTTGVFAFAAIAWIAEEECAVARCYLPMALIGMSLFQSAVAIGQYFKQGYLGLRLLGEISFHNIDVAPGLEVFSKTRWSIDSWLEIFRQKTLILRSHGTLSHPNVLAGFLAIAALFTLYFYTQSSRWKKGLLGAAFFAQFFALIITYSRSGLYAFFLSTFLWLFFLWRMKEKAKIRSSLILFLISSCAIWVLFSEQLRDRGGITCSNELSTASNNFRITYQDLALKMIQRHPVLGVGYGEFAYRIPEFLSADADSQSLHSATHNIYLLVASETGLLSLLLFAGFLLSLIRDGMRLPLDLYRAALLSIVGALLFIGACDFYLISSQQGRLLFFTLLGMLAAANKRASLSNSKSVLQPI